MADERLDLWADEGGFQLRLHRADTGVRFEVWNGDERAMSATLASFRLRRVADFLLPGINHEESLRDAPVLNQQADPSAKTPADPTPRPPYRAHIP